MDPSLTAYLASAKADAHTHLASAQQSLRQAYTATWWQGYIVALDQLELAMLKEQRRATQPCATPLDPTPPSTTPLSVEVHDETHESYAPTQPSTTPLSTTPTYATIELMLDQGGNFVRHLAQTWSAADPHNKRLLEQAFTELFAKYATQLSGDATTLPSGQTTTLPSGQAASLRGS